LTNAEKIKKLSLVMIRWASGDEAQRVNQGNEIVIINPHTKERWQDDFTFILKCEKGKLTRDKKIRLNKIWKAYNGLRKYNLKSS
jgi:hypothetical protein|tara:strand:+ start:452 stop:706 length:255 start_codon:yes stop_codon:yes gene_type:complete